MLSVVFGILVSVGWTGISGLPYTPLHALLPFLMIGLGIDNMFVIVKCWYNLDRQVRVSCTIAFYTHYNKIMIC